MLQSPLGQLGGLKVIVVNAQRQMRTTRDVKVARLRPKVPSKARGRKGTRKGWKRKHPPHWLLAYREPEDVLVMNGDTIIATERQYATIRDSDTHAKHGDKGTFGSASGE